jgi:hypothetical protein
MKVESASSEVVPYNFIFVCVGLFAVGLVISVFNLFIVGIPSDASLIRKFRSELDSAPAVASRNIGSDNPAFPQMPAEVAQGKVFTIETPDQNRFLAVYIDEKSSGELLFRRSVWGWDMLGGSLGGPNGFKQSETLVVEPITSMFPSYYGILGWRINDKAQQVRFHFKDDSQSTHSIEAESFVIGDFGNKAVCFVDVLDANGMLIEQVDLESHLCSES